MTKGTLMKRWMLAAAVGLFSFAAFAADPPAEGGDKAAADKTAAKPAGKKSKKKADAPKDAEKKPETK